MCSEEVKVSAVILPEFRIARLGENKIFFKLGFKMENVLDLISQETV
jgi:hypothetical protein